MSWILVAVLAYLILAVVNLADKFILEQIVPRAKTYTFLVGLAGLLIFIIAPWTLSWPGWNLWLITILTGATFSVALLFFYYALKNSEASRITTLVGGTVPIMTLFLSIIFFKESFSLRELVAILFLVAGTVIISIVDTKRTIWFKVKEWFHIPAPKQGKSILLSLLAALCFALYWVGTKYTFNNQEFLSALIWIRLGSFLAVLVLVLRKKDRESIKKDLLNSNQKKQNKFIFFGAQGLAAIGSLLQNYAVALGSVVLVTSLQGLQYAFILIFTFLLSLFYPKIIKENQSKKIIIKKIIAILLIGLGLYFITT
jgi:drug/metabolite transporter (DMT)-like permease